MASWLVRSPPVERSGFELWPGTLCCALGQDTLLSLYPVPAMPRLNSILLFVGVDRCCGSSLVLLNNGDGRQPHICQLQQQEKQHSKVRFSFCYFQIQISLAILEHAYFMLRSNMLVQFWLSLSDTQRFALGIEGPSLPRAWRCVTERAKIGLSNMSDQV